jgi:hypothetical protein
MKTLSVVSACAFLAFAAPAFAQSAVQKDLKNNGSPDGAGYSHEGQPGDRGAESGKAPKVNEGRASAPDPTSPGANSNMK